MRSRIANIASVLCISMAALSCGCSFATNATNSSSNNQTENAQTQEENQSALQRLANEVKISMADEKASRDETGIYKNISYADALDMARNRKTGVLFFSKDGCSGCESTKPILAELADQASLSTIYCADLDDFKKGSPQSDEMLKLLDGYTDYDTDGNPQLSAPLLVLFANGEIIGKAQSFPTGENSSDEKRGEWERNVLDMLSKVKSSQ